VGKRAYCKCDYRTNHLWQEVDHSYRPDRHDEPCHPHPHHYRAISLYAPVPNESYRLDCHNEPCHSCPHHYWAISSYPLVPGKFYRPERFNEPCHPCPHYYQAILSYARVPGESYRPDPMTNLATPAPTTTGPYPCMCLCPASSTGWTATTNLATPRRRNETTINVVNGGTCGWIHSSGASGNVSTSPGPLWTTEVKPRLALAQLMHRRHPRRSCPPVPDLQVVAVVSFICLDQIPINPGCKLARI
jgi:hypothetical protein